MRKTVFLLAAGGLVQASCAFAADPAEETPLAASPWVIQVTPYLWASGIKGHVSPFQKGPTIEIEKSFKDILDDLNFGGFVNLWARKDRLVLSGDLMYVDTTDAHAIGHLPVIGPTPGLSADVDTAQFTATLQAGYRVYESPQFSFDILGGARIWHISNEVTINYGSRSVGYKEDFGWIDPVVSARAFYNFTDKFSVLGQGDIGGFGVGSDFTWQVLGTLNYAFNDNFAVSAGYKALSVDYENDGHVFDATLQGPVLGLTYRF